MGDHVCRPFLMRCDSYRVDALDGCWVLHVFDVDGEEDILAVVLLLGSGDDYPSFQDFFESSFREKSSSHPGAALCPGCRPADRSRWLSGFTDWVKDAYSAMPSVPTPVEEVPELVRLSLECVYGQSCRSPTSSPLN